MPGRLSPQQVQFFKDEGYLLYDQPVFPQAEFDALKATSRSASSSSSTHRSIARAFRRAAF